MHYINRLFTYLLTCTRVLHASVVSSMFSLVVDCRLYSQALRDVKRGQTLEAETTTLRPKPKPNLQRPKRTLYFTVKIYAVTRGQSNLTKSASRGAHSPVKGHPRGSKVVPLNSWVGFPISVP